MAERALPRRRFKMKQGGAVFVLRLQFALHEDYPMAGNELNYLDN
ncbi:hypothetical protein [Janthinobacterium sp.]|nr:hypothetical protein [Janthinobacterium sp.]